MKQDWKSLPPALQHQLIIQMGLAVCCLVLAIGALAFISFSVSVPFLLGAALLTICAARLYHTGMRGQYLILRGVILKVERTAPPPTAKIHTVGGKREGAAGHAPQQACRRPGGRHGDAVYRGYRSTL